MYQIQENHGTLNFHVLITANATCDILSYPDLIIIDIYSLSSEDVVVEVPDDFPTKVCHKLGVLVAALTTFWPVLEISSLVSTTTWDITFLLYTKFKLSLHP